MKMSSESSRSLSKFLLDSIDVQPLVDDAKSEVGTLGKLGRKRSAEPQFVRTHPLEYL